MQTVWERVMCFLCGVAISTAAVTMPHMNTSIASYSTTVIITHSYMYMYIFNVHVHVHVHVAHACCTGKYKVLHSVNMCTHVLHCNCTKWDIVVHLVECCTVNTHCTVLIVYTALSLSPSLPLSLSHLKHINSLVLQSHSQ